MNLSETTEFASDSGHWYTKDGEPAYTQPNKTTGGIRPTTLRDAKKLNLYPSVTTICKVVAAPGLVNWMVEQAVMSALTIPLKDGESEQDFLSRIRADAKAQAANAADFGTRVHGAIERHYQNKPYDNKLALFVAGAVEEVEKHFPGGGWSAEKAFSCPDGYGGKVDLHRPWDEAMGGVLIDFKGKDGDLKDVECYDEHHMQAAAYANGLYGAAPKVVTANCFFSRTHPGVAKMVIHTEKEIQRGWRMFRAAKDLWCAQKDYCPS